MTPALKTALLAVSLAALCAGCGVTASSRNPGYASFDEASLRGLQRDTSLSLGPAVLHFAARHVENDPAARALLAALDGVRVTVYRLDDTAQLAAISERVSASAAALGPDWQPVVRVVEEDSTVHVLLKHSEDAILGLAILAVDGEQIVFVNVMGELTTDMLADLSPAIPREQALALRHIPL